MTRQIRLWGPLTATSVLLFACGGGGDDGPSTDTIALDCREKNECEVAGPLDRSVATSIVEESRYLLEGKKPLQKDVKEGALDPEQMALLHGRVVDKAGEPLLGVKVSVVGHADWGWVYSRADGSYELVVNGGGTISVSLRKDDFVAIQRSASVAWQAHGYLGEAALVQKSETSARLSPKSGATFSGDSVDDESGKRQPFVIFAPETSAKAVLPSGDEKELSDFELRVTELPLEETSEEGARFSAGTTATPGLTFGLAFEVSEAEELGAARVEFDKPVGIATENFLELETGEKINFAYYNEETSDWEDEHALAAIQIVEEEDGSASVDADGDGRSDSDDELEELGLDENARKRLAERYAPGDSLLWTTVEHFSQFTGTASSKVEPTNETPVLSAPRLRPLEKQSRRGRVRVENQALAEPLPLVGTPVSLLYQSDRTTAYTPGFELELPLIGKNVPANLVQVIAEVKIAGRPMTKKLKPAKNLKHTFTWDGLDHLKRLVQGQQLADIKITYEYPGVLDAKTKKVGPNVRLSATATVPVGVWDASGYELGGVSLDVLHAFDPVHKSLHFGTGDDRRAENIALVVKNLANAEELGIPDSLAAAPDGSIVMSDDSGGRILRVSKTGEVKVVAEPYDKGPGEAADIVNAQGVAIAKDGAIWFADLGQMSIGRITTGGKYECIIGYSDQKPKVKGEFGDLETLSFGPGGELYFVNGTEVYRYSGTSVTKFAGGGSDTKGDGIKATDKSFKQLSGIVAGPDGSVYVAERDGHRVHKITKDGIVRSIIGTGKDGFGGDGSAGTLATLNEPRGLALGKDGTLYVSDMGNGRVRMLTPDGIIDTILGGGENEDAEGMLATSAKLERPDGLAIDSSGALTVATATGVLRVVPGAPKLKTTETLVPSPDGRELFQFDARGKHLATLDRLSGVKLFQFGYDSSGRLTSLTDQSGNKTKFERDDAGKLKQIVGPFGSTTKVALTEMGILSSLTDPLGRVTTFEYDPASKLLSSSKDPEGNVYGYDYDPTHRLTSVTDPTGRKESYSREILSGGARVKVTSTGGAVREYTSQVGAGGSLTRSVKGPDGSTSSSVDKITTISVKLADGSKLFVMRSPDPYFGPQVMQESYEHTTPSGIVKDVSEVSLLNGVDAGNALSFADWQQSVSVNEVQTNTKYVRKSRTLTTTSPEGRTETTVFDEKGRLASKTVPGFGTTKWTYDSAGRPTLVSDTGGSLTRESGFGYDKLGFTSKLTDALGRSTLLTNDVVGRTTDLKRIDGKKIVFAYDDLDNVTGITPPDRKEYSFAYENLVQLSSITPPVVATEPEAGAVSFAYGSNRELKKMTFADGGSIGFGYDWAERLKETKLASATISYAYASGGRLASVSRSDSVKVAMAYDGPLLTGVTYSGAITGTVEAVYSKDFRLSAVTVNDASTATYAHDLDGNVLKAAVGANDEFLLTIGRAKDSGLPTSSTFGLVATAHSYSSLGELLGTSATASGGSFSQKLERDKLGRVFHITEKSGATTTEIYFEYDSMNRLSKETKAGVVTSYTYDSNGNRLSVTTGGTTTKATYDEQDRIKTQGTNAYTFSPAGQLWSRKSGTTEVALFHDELGNLTQAQLTDGATLKTLEYVIDGLGRRVGRRVDGVFDRAWLYQDRLRPAAEITSGGVLTHFVYADGGEGGAPDFMVRASVGYRFVKDHLGSVRRVINAATGAVVQELEYDAFGRVLKDTSPGFQPFGFAGGLYDPDSKLVHFGARDYDPGMGRWINIDPIGFAGGQTNLYAYVDSDPVNRVDPRGTWGFFLGGGAGAGAIGSNNASCGSYIGTEGFGNYCAYVGALGLGAHAGLGTELGFFWSLEAFQGAGYGVKLEGAAGLDGGFVGLANASGFAFSLSGGVGIGAYGGAAIGETKTFNHTTWDGYFSGMIAGGMAALGVQW